MAMEIAMNTPLAHALGEAIRPRLLELGRAAGYDDSVLSEHVLLVDRMMQREIADKLAGGRGIFIHSNSRAMEFARCVFTQVDILTRQHGGDPASAGQAVQDAAMTINKGRFHPVPLAMERYFHDRQSHEMLASGYGPTSERKAKNFHRNKACRILLCLDSIIEDIPILHSTGANEAEAIILNETESDSLNIEEEQKSEGPSPTEIRRRIQLDTDKDGEEEEEGQEREPPRKRQKASGKDTMARFACPYQVYGASQNCLRKSQRNPEGGCAGINRLRQHLSRRHMKSYRCKRCWRSFDSKHKVEDHQEQQYPCEPKAMPTNERFMSDDHEAELEKGRQSKSEDEAWWDIFRLLIPGMQRRDIGSLMREYWPYYIDLGPTLIMPSIMPPSAALQATMLGQQTAGALFPSGLGFLDLAQEELLSGASSTNFILQPIQQPVPPFISSIPVFETASNSNAHDAVSLDIRPPSQATTTETGSPKFGSASVSDVLLSSHTSSSFLADVPAPSESHVQRNCERLRARNREIESDNTKLRRINHENLTDLNHLDAGLEDLLGSEDMENRVFERLSELSTILSRVRRRLG